MANNKKPVGKKIIKTKKSNKKTTTKGVFAVAAPQWKKIISTWQSYSDPVRYVISATVVGIIILFMLPNEDINSEENPLGIKVADLEVRGTSAYSAEPTIAYSSVNSAASSSSATEVAASDIGPTKRESSIIPMAQQEAEYEAYFASLQESRRINGRPVSLPPINNMTSSNSSQSQSSTSTSRSQSSSSTSTSSSSSPAATAAESNNYTVRAGDNLYRIGVNHGLNLDEIMALNGMSVPEVTPGQIIRVR